MSEEKMVTVCAECRRACCWWGIFYCDEARTADIMELPLSTLKQLDLESPHYWYIEEAQEKLDEEMGA